MNDLMWSKQEKQSFINGPRFNDERLQLFSISRLRFIAFLACSSSLVCCFIPLKKKFSPAFYELYTGWPAFWPKGHTLS